MKIGGANSPTTNPNKLRKHGYGCVSTAMVWPGGHTRLVGLSHLVIPLYLLLVFPFQLQDLMKSPLIFGFNHLIWEDSFYRFSTSLICHNLC